MNQRDKDALRAVETDSRDSDSFAYNIGYLTGRMIALAEFESAQAPRPQRVAPFVVRWAGGAHVIVAATDFGDAARRAELLRPGVPVLSVGIE